MRKFAEAEAGSGAGSGECGLKSGAMGEIKVINRGGQAYCVKRWSAKLIPCMQEGGMTIAQSP